MNDFTFLPNFETPGKDVIGWVFFSIIVSLLIFGTIVLHNRKSRWVRSLEQVNGDELLSFDDLKSRVTSTYWDNFLLNLPSIFLMIGLLGTFINLGIALNHLSYGKNGQINPNELSLALQSIGTKFKTSVWGVLANLIFRGQLFAIYGGQLKTLLKEKISWHNQRISRANSDREQKLIEIAERKTDLRFVALDKTNRDGFESTNQGIGMSIQTAAKTNQILEKANQNLEKIIEIFKNFDNNTKNLVEGGALMKSSVLELKTIIKNVSDSLITTTKSFAEKTDQFVEAVGNFEKNTESVLTSVSSSIENFNGTVKESFEKFEKGVSETLKGISDTLEQSTTKLKESVSNGLEAMTNETKRMINSTEEMKQINSDLRRQLAELRRTWNDSNDVFQKMSDLNSYLNNRSEAVFKPNGQLEKLFEKVIESVKAMAATDRQKDVILLLNRMNDTLDQLLVLGQNNADNS